MGARGAAGFCPSPSPGTEGSQHRPHPASQPRIPLQSQPKLDPAPGLAPPAARLDGSQHGSCPGMRGPNLADGAGKSIPGYWSILGFWNTSGWNRAQGGDQNSWRSWSTQRGSVNPGALEHSMGVEHSGRGWSFLRGHSYTVQAGFPPPRVIFGFISLNWSSPVPSKATHQPVTGRLTYEIYLGKPKPTKKREIIIKKEDEEEKQ